MLWPAMEKAASCGVRRPVQNRPACGVQVATTTFQLKLYSLLEPNNLVRDRIGMAPQPLLEDLSAETKRIALHRVRLGAERELRLPVRG